METLFDVLDWWVFGSAKRKWGTVVALFVVVTAICLPVYLSTGRYVTATVTDKAPCSHTEVCQYLIYTDQGTYQESDSWIALKFQSADLYGKIDRGGTYRFHVRGWRVPVLSAFPNILDASPTAPVGAAR